MKRINKDAIKNNDRSKTAKVESTKKEGSIFKVKAVKIQNVPLMEQGCIR
jgi:hypothetical protein